MSDLTEFLAARLDEDAAVAEGGDQTSPDMTYRLDERLEWVSVTPARVLAEVKAKRLALKRHNECGTGIGYCDDGGHGIEKEDGAGFIGCPDLLDMASTYAAHPDYRPEWGV